ncbi:sensor histidine kinase [Streptomyces sp. URMC 123]|uniref:sensor histidine kinase n=1 Tax=Streptomyces sp. URMC 123 TaxID=3423403 RepID=UPI003F1D4CB1
MTSLAVGQGLARPKRWLHAHPLAFDAVLAAAALALVLIASVVEPHRHHAPRLEEHRLDATSAVLAVVACAALVVRRRRPLAVLAFTSAVTLTGLALGTEDPRTPIAFAVVIALYTVASRTDRPTTWRVGALTVVGLTAAAMALAERPWYAQENLGIFAWTGMAAAAGDAVRSRRAFVAAIEERAERAERTREEEARRRVAEERMRIARELHDVVAHHIALVNVQAGVAAHVMDKRPDQAREALAHVREASRSALRELRATVGLLRQSGDPEAPTEPAPGLDLLDQLVDSFRHAGLPVEVTRRAAVDEPLPAGVDLAAYRVIQEALTNVHKHAGDGARAEVTVAVAEGALEVTVVDDGAGRPAPGPGEARSPHGRHGLTGMRERAAALGGHCAAGPVATGGFRVHVRLPLTGVGPAPAEGDRADEGHDEAYGDGVRRSGRGDEAYGDAARRSGRGDEGAGT